MSDYPKPSKPRLVLLVFIIFIFFFMIWAAGQSVLAIEFSGKGTVQYGSSPDNLSKPIPINGKLSKRLKSGTYFIQLDSDGLTTRTVIKTSHFFLSSKISLQVKPQHQASKLASKGESCAFEAAGVTQLYGCYGEDGLVASTSDGQLRSERIDESGGSLSGAGIYEDKLLLLRKVSADAKSTTVLLHAPTSVNRSEDTDLFSGNSLQLVRDDGSGQVAAVVDESSKVYWIKDLVGGNRTSKLDISKFTKGCEQTIIRSRSDKVFVFCGNSPSRNEGESGEDSSGKDKSPPLKDQSLWELGIDGSEKSRIKLSKEDLFREMAINPSGSKAVLITDYDKLGRVTLVDFGKKTSDRHLVWARDDIISDALWLNDNTLLYIAKGQVNSLDPSQNTSYVIYAADNMRVQKLNRNHDRVFFSAIKPIVNNTSSLANFELLGKDQSGPRLESFLPYVGGLDGVTYLDHFKSTVYGKYTNPDFDDDGNAKPTDPVVAKKEMTDLLRSHNIDTSGYTVELR